MNLDLLYVAGSICSIIALFVAGGAHVRVKRVEKKIESIGRDKRGNTEISATGNQNVQAGGDIHN